MFPSIDFKQVAILTRYALTSEWRVASLRMRRNRKKMSRVWAYWTMILYLIIGAFSVRLFIQNSTGDAYVTALGIFFLYAAFVIASNIFMSFGTGFLSPDETQIIAPLPVSSETFFFSRLAVLICYTSLISFLLAIGPFVGLEFFFRPGIAANLALVITMVLSGVAAALAVIVLYGLLLRIIGKSAIVQAFSYVQFVGSFVTAISFVVLSQVQQRIDLHTFTIVTTPWIALIPSIWFASLAALTTGLVSGLHVLLAVGSLVFLAALSGAAHVLLGKHYKAEVEELSTASTTNVKRRHGRESIISRIYAKFARSDEARAVFVVLRAQFRYDAKFRMQLLASLPPTFLYLLIAIFQGGITDPFGGSLREVARANMFYLVAMLMPLIAMQSVAQSENYKASWLFFAMPLDREKLLLAVRNTLLVSIILPYMIILAVIFSYYMPIYHAVAHTLVLAAVAGLNFQLYLMAAPKMPFAQPRRPNRGGFAYMAGIFFFTGFSMVIFVLVLYFGYHSASRFWPIFLLLVTLSAVLERVVHSRVRAKLAQEEYEG